MNNQKIILRKEGATARLILNNLSRFNAWGSASGFSKAAEAASAS
jgi:hypothetical protein